MMLAPAKARWRALLQAKATGNDFSSVLLDLAGDSAQYFVGLVLIGLGNTVLLPLYMRYLNPSQFGLYALIEITSLALLVVAGLGFNTSYLKYFAEGQGGGPSRLLGSMTLASGAAASAAGTAFAVFVGSEEGARLLGAETKQFAYLLFPLLLLEALHACFENHLRASRRPTSISISALIRLVAIAAFSVWLMAVRKEGLTGLFEGRVLGDACSLIAIAFFCRRDFTLRISVPLSKAMLRYGTPLVMIALMMIGLDAAGRYLLDSYGSLNSVGLYTAGIKISNFMRILFVAPLGAAWGGLMFRIAKKPNAQFIYSKLFGYVFLLSGTVAVGVTLLTPELFAVFAAPAYRAAMGLVPWLLLVQVLSILHAPLATGLYVGHATRWLIPIYTTGLAADVALGRMMVPVYGIYGAAWAWLLGLLVICALMIIVGQRSYPLRFEWKPIAVSLALCLAVPLMPRLGVMNLEPLSIGKQFVCGVTAAGVTVTYIVRDIRKSRAAFDRGFVSKRQLGGLAAEAD